MTCTEAVLGYLETQNRPFNNTNLVDALQSTGFKKGQIQSALDTLAGDGRVTCIENGKQKVYLALQTSSDAPPEETQALEEEAVQLSRQLTEAKKRHAELAAEMRSLGKAASTEQLLATAAKLNAESEQMEAKLASLRDGSAIVLSPEDRAQAELLAIAFFDAWASRRKGFKALWSSVLEAAEMSSKELKDVVAFDDDEGAGANFEEAKKLVDSIKAARFKRKGAKPA